MAISFPKFLTRRTILLSGLFSFVLIVMYLSSSGKEESEFSSSLPLPLKLIWVDSQPLQDIFSSSEEDNIPEDLQSRKTNFQIPFKKPQEPQVYGQPSKKILIWNSYWRSKALWNKIFAEIVHKRCPQSNCEFTNDRADLSSSDAVIFHMVDIPGENYTFPQDRNPSQVWIGMTYEPPYILEHAGLNFTKLNGIFNRTMSYRTDGDIVVRHGTLSKLKYPQQFPSYVSNWVNSHDNIDSRNYAFDKRRLVAWFASSRNCQSQSGREKYVKELQNYIQVDIYGSCGPYKCGSQKNMRNPYKVEEDDCYMLVSVGYKFILAFENSLCEDYVTEKLYNHLKLNVVPVVLGASNYSLFAPPHSIIDASQYTPEELAEYLQLLDKNDTLYNEYFEWKKDFAVESNDGVPLACDLCEQLHNPNWQVERKVYDQFDKWIVSGCRKGYGE